MLVRGILIEGPGEQEVAAVVEAAVLIALARCPADVELAQAQLVGAAERLVEMPRARAQVSIRGLRATPYHSRVVVGGGAR
jgi:hypothetical protein